MKKLKLIIPALCLGFGAYSQVEVVGHNFLNNVPLKNTKVFVKEGGRVIETIDTKGESEFKFEVDFGKVYNVYLQNEKCVLMHFDIMADNIPKNKWDYGMNHTFDVPFYNKTDVDVDTAVFANAFYRIIFDGKKRMIDDTAYSTKFSAGIIKKHVKQAEPEAQVTQTVATHTEPAVIVFAGKVFLNNDKLQPVKNKATHAIDKSGKVIKSTSTNRFGAFSFTGVKAEDIARIKMDVAERVTRGGSGQKTEKSSESAELLNGNLGLYNSKAILLQISKPSDGVCFWDLSPRSVESLSDDNYSSNIGGKLVSSSPRDKKFFANKTVYLSNNLNTILSKTKTNMLGSFVFEDIRPDHIYYIGVDKSELGPGEKIDLLNKDDAYIATLDSVLGGRSSLKVHTDYNSTFNKLTIDEGEMKMDIKATIYGDNINHPIGKLKIVLLNDSYQPIDSVVTDNFGAFKFKYLPFLKRFYLSAENTDAVLDEFKNILIYSGDQTLVKVLTHQKGKRFTYNPVSGEMTSLRDVELEDPWLEFIDKKTGGTAAKRSPDAPKTIIENILFESNKYNISDDAREILDKIILVMNTNKDIKIEIGAHTDSKGTSEMNMELSEMRAKTVKDYITNAGISASRIISKGYGETKLLNKCADGQNCSEEEHAKNRRIEFKILGE